MSEEKSQEKKVVIYGTEDQEKRILEIFSTRPWDVEMIDKVFHDERKNSIRFHRERMRMTQEMVAQLIGADCGFNISVWERSRRVLTADWALKFCKLFSIDMEDLFTERIVPILDKTQKLAQKDKIKQQRNENIKQETLKAINVLFDSREFPSISKVAAKIGITEKALRSRVKNIPEITNTRGILFIQN